VLDNDNKINNRHFAWKGVFTGIFMLNIGVECHFVLFKISDDRCHIHIPLKMVNMPFTDNRNVQRFVQRQLAEGGRAKIFSPHPLLLAKVNVQLYKWKTKLFLSIIYVNMRQKEKKIWYKELQGVPTQILEGFFYGENYKENRFLLLTKKGFLIQFYKRHGSHLSWMECFFMEKDIKTKKISCFQQK